MATRRKSTFSLKEEEEELISTAAKMLFVNRSDFVRLAVRTMLQDLSATFSELAAMQAHRLFIDKAWNRWGIPFEEIDFRQGKVQQWLREMNTQNVTLVAEITPNNLIPLNLNVGFDSVFDKYRRDENPRIVAIRAKNDQAYRNSPSMPGFDFAKLVFVALDTASDNLRREAAEQEVCSKMRRRIETEFSAIITKFRALPRLISTARELGGEQRFLLGYRSDPETLARFVFHERLNALLKEQQLRNLDDPAFSSPPITSLIDRARRVGVPPQQIEANRQNSKELQRCIIRQQRSRPDDLWLTTPPQGVDEYLAFLSEPSQ